MENSEGSLANNSVNQKQSEFNGLEAVVKDSHSLVMTARQGISTALAFQVARAMQIHPDQLAHILHLSSKTLKNYHQLSKKLNIPLSEQTLKLLALYLKGNEVFGEMDSFRRWLEKPAYGLGEQIPFTLLETSGGIDLLMEELDRIAYGDFS